MNKFILWSQITTILFISNIFINASIKAESNCLVVDQVIKELQSIRKLRIKREVPCVLQNKNEVLSFIKKNVADKKSLKKLQYQGAILTALNVIPKDFDYVNKLLQFYTDQVGGYYDPKSKRYIMASWLPDMVQPTVASHELTHALQDQYFNLTKFLDDKSFTTDEGLAKLALVEGDATLSMQDYARSHQGLTSILNEPDVQSYILQTVVGMSATANSIQIPNILVSMLVFPYTSGLRFVHKLAKSEGMIRIDNAFKLPPKTTKEILHPEIFNNEIPRDKINRIKDSASIFTDSLGEFFISLWLKQMGLDFNKSSKIAYVIQDDYLELFHKKIIWSFLIHQSEQEAISQIETIADANHWILRHVSSSVIQLEVGR